MGLVVGSPVPPFRLCKDSDKGSRNGPEGDYRGESLPPVICIPSAPLFFLHQSHGHLILPGKVGKQISPKEDRDLKDKKDYRFFLNNRLDVTCL
ncbi:hypothetical protein J6590_016979 [Homalodisca vitripennis]|nr:hypothetical protein J6590_016979 [Homalodisca vitripennis]